MPATHADLQRNAQRHFRRVAPELAALMARIGPFAPKVTSNPFVALLGSITHQQVSMAAGTTIFNRLLDLCPRRRLTPAAIQALDEPTLRTAGLSRQKVTYIRNIADEFASGHLTSAKLRRMPDEDVIAATTRIKGVGRWTAEMLLIFSLERPDVWPIDDLGLRNAVQRHLGSVTPLKPAELTALAEPWRPYRTIATWYLWRSLENPVQPGIANVRPNRKRVQTAR